ncbi:DUF3311 domain-containing protein [Gottfriedia sp. NPDC057948]|uniref:DUF3311 domain-containing protein n=2 Tax=unclassified Gottfriedia TaxID=2837516 RepID=UPI0036D8DE52
MKKLLYGLSAIPAIGSLTVINKVEPFVLGMPFVLFWTILWVFLTAIFLLIVNKLDPANKGGDQ